MTTSDNDRRSSPWITKVNAMNQVRAMWRCARKSNSVLSALNRQKHSISSLRSIGFTATSSTANSAWQKSAGGMQRELWPLQRATFCSDKAPGPPKELEILPLPEGISDQKFQMFELQGTAGTADGKGLTSVLAVHGPPEGWSREGEPLYGANGGCFAVIEAGGSQRKVVADNAFYINRIKGEVNESIVFDKVLLIGTVAWSVFGRPYIPTATVVGTIEEQTLSGKVFVVKFKKRKGYRRRQGHRQNVTRVRINEVKFSLPDASLLTPFEVELDPLRPPLPNSPTFM